MFTPTSEEVFIFPLSFAQERLWFIDQLDPGNSSYNISSALQLEGQLNITALERAIQEIQQRHEVLRTSFKVIDAVPFQVIASAATLTLPVLELKGMASEEQFVKVQRHISSDARKPFNLSTDSLLRVNLLKLAEHSHVLQITVHHIIADVWSIGIFIQELTALYKAFCQGKLSPLPELPIQYADFSEWQRQWLSGKVLESQLNYWKQQLAGAPPLLELPTDRPRPPVQTFRGSSERFQFNASLTEQIRSLSQQSGATLFMTLLAAFALLLSRYSHQKDIIVGSSIANRNRQDIETLIGFFVNTLVLRIDLQSNPTFWELLQQVRQTTLDAYDQQDLPFEQLVEALQPKRSLSHHPLFQVMFVLQNAPIETLELPGLTLTPLQPEHTIAKFDLTLTIQEIESKLVGTWEYNSDLFEAETIRRMIRHFQTLCEAIANNPEQPVSQLPLLTGVERHQLLVEWNQTSADYPQDKCIHQLFEEQVERSPDSIAVVFEDSTLTYQELNTRANQLAHYLQTLGVEAEVLVGICVERSLEMVIGLLGILKAGGAYVPIDPTYPGERIAYMLSDSRLPILLTQQKLVASLPEQQARVACLDADWEEISAENELPPISGVMPENLAYVIYTSGSTGKPKGVKVAHQGLCNLAQAQIQLFDVKPDSCVLQFASLSFDASISEIVMALCAGAKLCLGTSESLQPGQPLLQLLQLQRITHVTLVPSALATLPTQELLALQNIVVAGEPCPANLVASWAVGRRFFNAYGPTESTVCATVGQCFKGTGAPAIGRPIDNTQIYILDPYLQPVPIGISGELHIASVGLARGYLHHPNLTEEKFIPNPFSSQPGERLYKTGDLACYLPDGNIEFLGRIDNQVKIRGFRIELGEIEANINQHPAVRETVVVVRSDIENSQRLVAYIVLEAEQTLAIAELRRFLESKLPNYMVPQAFVMLEALPLTPNGKVDRKALPVPERIHPELEKAFIAPQTTVEKQLAVIWAQVLGLEKIGINDNFFELGGDSILSLQIISKANLAGLHLTPKQLFQHQTIAQLAAVAGTTKSIQAEQGAVTGLLPLTPIQHWFFAQQQPDPHHWNQAVLLEVKQTIDPGVLEQVVRSLQKHHDVLRLRFIPEEFGTQAIFTSPDDVVPITHSDLSILPKEEQAAAITAIATKLQASLNLSTGSLFQIALFDLGDSQPNRLLWVIHHLVVDGVSWRILIEDFQTVYWQLCQGKTIQLPPKTTSFQQWSHCLEKYAKSSELRSEVDYWLTRARQTVKPIARDFSHGDNTQATACSISVSLGVEETQVLLQQIPVVYQTQINDILLTALTQTFAQWTGENSLLIDLEGHGREELFEDVDLSRTVGWFTSLFPVHLSLENPNVLGKALMSIKEQLRAIPNRGIGYGVLHYLSKEEEITEQLNSLPQAEVIFNYLGQFDQVLPESSLFSLAQESIGSAQSLSSKRSHLLEINSIITQGRLQVKWTYSQRLYRQTTVEALAHGFIEALRSLIAHCQSPDAGSFTPSDFAEFQQSQWNQTDLDAITQAIEGM